MTATPTMNAHDRHKRKCNANFTHCLPWLFHGCDLTDVCHRKLHQSRAISREKHGGRLMSSADNILLCKQICSNKKKKPNTNEKHGWNPETSTPWSVGERRARVQNRFFRLFSCLLVGSEKHCGEMRASLRLRVTTTGTDRLTKRAASGANARVLAACPTRREAETQTSRLAVQFWDCWCVSRCRMQECLLPPPPGLNCRSTTSMWDMHTKRPFQAFTLRRKPRFPFTHSARRVRARTHTTRASRSRERARVLNGWLIFLNVTRVLQALGVCWS